MGATMFSNMEEHLFDFLKVNFLKALQDSKLETNTKFNQRSFTAVGMLLSGLGLPFSGYMNHLLGFDTLSASRHIWMSVHNILAIFFTFFSAWHIILNRKGLMNHLKKSSQIFISKESVYAISLVLFFLALAILHAAAASGRL